MKKMIYWMLALVLSGTASMNAQVTIGSLEDPHAGAILDLRSTSKGLLLPNVVLDADLTKFKLDGEVDKSRATGMLVYNTTDNKVYFWNGTTWKTTYGASDESLLMHIGNNDYLTYIYNTGENGAPQRWMVENSKEGNAMLTTGANGYIYNWAQAIQSNNACPSGWRLPTESEYSVLSNIVNDDRSGKGKWWALAEYNAFAGYYSSNGGGTPFFEETLGHWWSGSEIYQYFSCTSTGSMNGPAITDDNYWVSVRCILEEMSGPGYGGVSVSKQIGDQSYQTHYYPTGDNGEMQLWMVENLKTGTTSNPGFNCGNQNVVGNNPGVCNEDRGWFYTWNEANLACPVGWSLPTEAQYDKLFGLNVSGTNAAGNGNPLIADGNTSTDDGRWWHGSGNSSQSFAGYQDTMGSTWAGWGNNGYWWASGSENRYYIGYGSGSLSSNTSSNNIFPIRCVRN